ncbi:hypothetical protein ACWDTI_13305 [Gordonia sp. NPDC003424]
MNLTARQSGGAVGIGVLAAIFAASPGGTLLAFHHLFVVCFVIALMSAALSVIPSQTKETQS